MVNKLFVLTVSLGVLTTFLSILALSLNYWQGKTLLYKELLNFGETENKDGGGKREGDRDEAANVKFSTVDDDSGTTPRSISALGEMVLTEKSSTESVWRNAVMNVHAGIWYSCIKVMEVPGSPEFVLPEECMYLEKIHGLNMPEDNKFVVWIRADWAAPRTLLFLGMFCMIACIICVVLRWYIVTDKVFLLFVAAGLSLIAEAADRGSTRIVAHGRWLLNTGVAQKLSLEIRVRADYARKVQKISFIFLGRVLGIRRHDEAGNFELSVSVLLLHFFLAVGVGNWWTNYIYQSF